MYINTIGDVFEQRNLPFNLNNLAHVLGSQSLKAFSVDPLTIMLPEGFIAKL